MSLKIVFICAICLMALSIASAESVSLPLGSVKKPANDLMLSSGQAIDAMEAAQRAARREDLSLLNPVDNKFWQNRTYSADDSVQRNYPEAQVGVQFLSDEAQLPFTYMARVQSLENPQVSYRLGLSRYTHAVLLRAAFLRKLGYFVPSPKYYKNLKVHFQSEAEKETFLKTAQETMISDFESRGWITQNDTVNHTLTFSDAILEPSENEFFDIQWGYAPDPNNPAQLPIVQRFSKYRAYRALIVPFAMVDVPESINRFTTKMASILSGHVVINHPSAESFSAATYEDVRWLLLRMKNWTRYDYEEIVRAGAFPQELNELLTAKLMHRASDAFMAFKIQSSLSNTLPSLAINSPSGLVKNGKVTREMVPGYPQRFAHGDRESPFKDGDFERYLGIRARTAALSTALAEINKKLQFLTAERLFENRRQTIIDRIRSHIKNNPMEPLYQNVEAWGGPVGGFNLGATRHITTGTYYGSSAPIQMVDNLSVSASLGWMMMVDGIQKVAPGFGANVQVLRDYTHVRPLMSITEGQKVEWKDLAIPWFMKGISKVLTKNDPAPGATADGSPVRHPVDEFLMELRDGEVFTVTDSITLSAYVQASSSFDVLLGLAPLGYINSVSISADTARVILKQTSFMRTSSGVQVYVRSQKTTAFGLSFDANYFIKLLKIRNSTQATELHTDAFIIDYNPELAAYIDTNSDQPVVKDFIETRKNLKPALWALFQSNESELLYSKFKYKKFDIDHKLKTKEMRTRFLAWRMADYNEDHTVQILYPASPDAPELKRENESVVLFSAKRGELKGRDLLGFATDWIEGLWDKLVGNEKAQLDLANLQDPNPANLPYGKAFWRTVNTEADLSPQAGAYPSVSILQHVWGGWHLDGSDFRKLLKEVDGKFKSTGVSPYKLVSTGYFHNTTAVDFYRITASLSILPGGVEKIRDLIIQPDADGKKLPKLGPVGRFFQKLSVSLGNGKPRVHDKEMYNEILAVLGNGDIKEGRYKFEEMCKPRHPKKESHPGDGGVTLNGTYFECMTPWMKKLLRLSRLYPKFDKKAQAQWTSEVLFILDEAIPMPYLMKYLGPKNYIFLVRVNGFRSGDEDGDLEFFSNTLGDPTENIEYANGLINMYAGKTRISPIELDRSQAGFR